jgi:cell wall-associated NlpC family hydrolase
MRSAYRRSVYLLLATIFVISNTAGANAKPGFMRKRVADTYTREVNFGSKTSGRSTNLTERKLRGLEKEIIARLGAPYRTAGIDDRGYDCSGFVWRVFHEAGVEFERSSTRRLWEILPEATGRERAKFGTLVFFRGLNHVGIVRDENTFYHVSSSQGVVLSEYSGYWEERLVGFRSALSLSGVEREQELYTARASKREPEKPRYMPPPPSPFPPSQKCRRREKI